MDKGERSHGPDSSPSETHGPGPGENLPFDVVFADTCIGGSTVASRLARTQTGLRAYYLADYAVNPLGVKPAFQVREALDGWVDAAVGLASDLIVACNTASVLLRATPAVTSRALGLGIRVSSMVDFAEALVEKSAESVGGRSVCLMGTEFTCADPFYEGLLTGAGAQAVHRLPATRTERAIAHLRHHLSSEQMAIMEEIGEAVRNAETVVLACTCFPLVGELIQKLNPAIRLLDPGQGVEDLTLKGRGAGPNLLTVALTGEVLSPEALEARAPILFPGWELEGVVRG